MRTLAGLAFVVAYAVMFVVAFWLKPPEQSAAVEEINSNLGSLDQIARSNASASEEMTETVVELSKLADQSRSEVERFTC